MPTQASSSTWVASMLLVVYTWKSCPQLLRTPAWAARWNTCVTPSSTRSRSAPWMVDSTNENRGRDVSDLEVRLFDRPRVVVGEAVDADHLGTAVEQLTAEVRRDEPGRARDEGLHTKSSRTAGGQARRTALRVHRRVQRAPAHDQLAARLPHDLVVELHAHSTHQRAGRLDVELIVVPRGPVIHTRRLDDRQPDAGVLHLAV